MEAVLIIGNNVDLASFDFNNKYVVGIDKGALYALECGIKLDLALGDFDSIDEDQFDLIKDRTSIKKLNPIKDDTDTFDAVKMLNDYSKITILGGIQGKRIEHFMANINMLKLDNRIEIIDNYSHIFIKNESFILKKDQYKYVSFFAVEDVFGLDLIGFKYDLSNQILSSIDSFCISNELTSSTGFVNFRKGKLLVIKSMAD